MNALNKCQAEGRVSGQTAGDLHAAISLSISRLAERLLVSDSSGTAAAEWSKAFFLVVE